MPPAQTSSWWLSLIHISLDITINPDETPDEDQKDDKNYDLNQSVEDTRHDGSDAYLDYTVTLVVKNEQADPLTLADSMTPVSYTHLDVYKRQCLRKSVIACETNLLVMAFLVWFS